MSLYATRKLVEATLTVSAINTQIDTLNTTLSESAPHVGQLADGAVYSPDEMTSFPAVLLYAGVLDPAATEVARTGKRDVYDYPLAISVHQRCHDLANAHRDVEVILEAILPVLETLRGQAHLTNWGIREVLSPRLEVVPFLHEGKTIRLDGILRCTLLVRRTGV